MGAICPTSFYLIISRKTRASRYPRFARSSGPRSQSEKKSGTDESREQDPRRRTSLFGRDSCLLIYRGDVEGRVSEERDKEREREKQNAAGRRLRFGTTNRWTPAKTESGWHVDRFLSPAVSSRQRKPIDFPQTPGRSAHVAEGAQRAECRFFRDSRLTSRSMRAFKPRETPSADRAWANLAIKRENAVLRRGSSHAKGH